ANSKHPRPALSACAAKKSVELFDRYKVFSPRETESRASVLYQMYVHRISVEALTMRDMASTLILPAGIEYQRRVAESISATAAASKEADLRIQRELLAQVST